MGIINSFYIRKKITWVSLDLTEPTLVQGVMYDQNTDTIVNTISRKQIFDLKTPNVRRLTKDTVYIKIHEQDIAVVYKFNDNGTITRINHLVLVFEDGSDLTLFNEGSIQNYYIVLKNIPKELTEGVFVKLSSGEYHRLDWMNWENEFNIKEGL